MYYLVNCNMYYMALACVRLCMLIGCRVTGV